MSGLGTPGSTLLAAAAVLNAVAGLLHVAIVFGGPTWYRFFGAGERMARLAEHGSPYATVITLCIASMLLVWAAYALSGAGLLSRLPLLRSVLIAITAIYLLRGVAGFVLAFTKPGDNSPAFWLWSSTICLGIGGVHAFGLMQRWQALTAGD